MTDVTFPLPPGLSRQQRSSWDKREYTPSALLAMGGAHRHTCSCKHIAPTPEQTREDAHSPAHRQGPTRVSVSLGPAQPRVTLLADTPLGICSLHGPPQRPAPRAAAPTPTLGRLPLTMCSPSPAGHQRLPWPQGGRGRSRGPRRGRECKAHHVWRHPKSTSASRAQSPQTIGERGSEGG